MATDSSTIVREIEDAARNNQDIPASKVKSWLLDSSIDVLGAVTQHIIRNSRRVQPPLSIDDICSTVQSYYRECLIQNLQTSDYAPNRSIAGYELVSWFRSLWRDPAVPRDYLVRLKTMLRDLCAENKVPRDQMVNAVLEHLFETPEIAEFFSDWKTDSLLSKHFSLAIEWAANPSRSPGEGPIV
jgi:hypothetical protein